MTQAMGRSAADLDHDSAVDLHREDHMNMNKHLHEHQYVAAYSEKCCSRATIH